MSITVEQSSNRNQSRTKTQPRCDHVGVAVWRPEPDAPFESFCASCQPDRWQRLQALRKATEAAFALADGRM